MDSQTLRSLEVALRASPDNSELLCVVLRQLLDTGEAPRARQLLDELPRGIPRDASARLVCARVYLATESAERALELVGDDSSESQLLRARALVALGRKAEAQSAYERAVAVNPTLEDVELRALIGAREVERQKGPTKLRLIANDDTLGSEVTRLFAPEAGRVCFEDVGGLDDIKQQIRRKIITPFKKPSLFQRFKKRAGGGILMYGPPGCGKTLLARATAGECDAQFLNVAISDILDMYIGESERKLHAIFEKARSSAPAILFFDELEALAGKRQYSRDGTASKLVSHFLSEMDGFSQNNTGVLILGATNVPWAVDSAFRRSGRFDRVLFVPPPDRAAREQILSTLLEQPPTEAGLDVAALAKRTSGFSGADLDNLVQTASDEAIEESLGSGAEVPIRAAHLERALKAIQPTTLEWLTTARNYARYANESGQYDEVLRFLDAHGRPS